MPDLIARITAALAEVNGPPWFPDLTEALVQAKWQELTRATGLSPLDYRTSRVLSADRNVPVDVVTHIPILLDGCEESIVAIESITGERLRQYESEGIKFYDAEEMARTSVVGCVKDAITILRLVPSLQCSVAKLVRALHIIKPENEDYDISFSEPHIPFSIFVSVPERRVQMDALRVAEAIVHEAMHLQLTLIEQVVPLDDSKAGLYFSPWRGEYRTAQGVLHALYVFRVIDSFLQELMSKDSLPIESLDYIKKRRSRIVGQICEIDTFKHCSDLSSSGANLVSRLLC